MGWRPFYQQQISFAELQSTHIARVTEHHRSGYRLWTEQGRVDLTAHESLPAMAVGDWLLLDQQQRLIRCLDRLSLFSRKAAGSKVERQLIAANIDTVFIVSSLNQDFNLSRIERYLSLVNAAEVSPVVVLTKADTCDEPEQFQRQLRQLDPGLMVETVNSLDADSVAVLSHWCKQGQTVAFLGSSGVGKSTLINTLSGHHNMETGAIREDDSKGRHTTTHRALQYLLGGGLLIDTPGMRELQLADCGDGVDATFGDVSELAQRCRFVDCSHEQEPGCAVQQAITSGDLAPRRLHHYQKLMREQALNGASLAERRAGDKATAKYHRSVQSQNRHHKGR